MNDWLPMFIDPTRVSDAVDRMVRSADPTTWANPLPAVGHVNVGNATANDTLTRLGRVVSAFPVELYDQLGVVAMPVRRGVSDAVNADYAIVDSSADAAAGRGAGR